MKRPALSPHLRPLWLIALLVALLFGLPATTQATTQHTTQATTQHTAEANTVAAQPAMSPAQAGSSDEDEPKPVDSLEDVQSAVIQIEAMGTFLDPEDGLMMNVPGRGSGFIISPDGLAVTNNHVVTGAALLRVYLAGESRPRNARVLGVSECADLALIQINNARNLPFLDWYEGPIRVGLDVYAAGFPLGDPEFTLTRGIVAKARADGDSSWASVTHILQHDATINPGNSGGPLITRDGQVVGVNYAGDNLVNQYFAISRDEVLDLLPRLEAGENVDSIGINGQAIYVSDELSGIWVYSVASGSPADNAGIDSGDFILALENLLLAQDGTMREYCEILRSRQMSDVMRVRVLRTGTGEVLTGQLNGRPLEVSFVYGQLSGETGIDEEPPATPGTEEDAPSEDTPILAQSYDGYVGVTDESGVITLEIPAAWEDVNITAWVNAADEVIGQAISGAADLDAYLTTWDEPGFFLGISEALAQEYDTVDDFLDGFDFTQGCGEFSRSDFAYGVYTGAYNFWADCGRNATNFVNLVMLPESNDHLLLLNLMIVSEADLDAFDQMLTTLQVTLPSPQADPQAAPIIDTEGLIYDYVTYQSGELSIVVPDAWVDILEEPWFADDGSDLGQIIRIAPDLDFYQESWEASGLILYRSAVLAEFLTPEEALDISPYDECTYEGRYTYGAPLGDEFYDGGFDLWIDCGGIDSVVYAVALLSDRLDDLLLMEFQATSEADLEAFSVAIRSLWLGTDLALPSPVDGAEPVTVMDPWSLLLVDLPADWTDTRHELWIIDDSPLGIQTRASPNLSGFENEWRTPGLIYRVASVQKVASLQEEVEIGPLLDTIDYSVVCTYGDRFIYEDALFAGLYDFWYDCGGLDTVSIVLLTVPLDDPDVLLLIQLQSPLSGYEALFDLVTRSFNLNRDVDVDELVAELWAEAQAEDDADVSTGPATGIESGMDATGDPIGVVVVNALNVRSGPGTNFGRVGLVQQGERLRIHGQHNNCAWLQVSQEEGSVRGWVSGSSQYVRFTVPCSAIPAATSDATPAAPSSGGAASGGASASQGCYTFQNNLNAELTITFTAQGREWNNTFRVPPRGERRECFAPGRYTYTLDAPPPWGSTNGDLTIRAGDNFVFPVNPE